VVVKAESVDTSTAYITGADPVRVALPIVNVIGCSLNLYIAPLPGSAATGDVKLIEGPLSEVPHAVSRNRAPIATTDLTCDFFMALLSASTFSSG
jgi:hypothetical protein